MRSRAFATALFAAFGAASTALADPPLQEPTPNEPGAAVAGGPAADASLPRLGTSPQSRRRRRTADNGVYVEGMGPALFYSIDYDRRFGDFAARIGLGYVPLSSYRGSASETPASGPARTVRRASRDIGDFKEHAHFEQHRSTSYDLLRRVRTRPTRFGVLVLDGVGAVARGAGGEATERLRQTVLS